MSSNCGLTMREERTFRLWLLVLLLASIGLLQAQSPSRKASVLVSASTSTSPAQITLSWPWHNGASAYTIYRRVPGTSSWGSPIATLNGSASSWTDQNVQLGAGYEYRVERSGNGIGYGYLRSGIELPAHKMHYRGKIMLVVESGLALNISSELVQLEDDLLGDGWYPIRIAVPASASSTYVKQQIEAYYANDPTRVKAVYLLGHVPVPYSGSLAPDGHGSHQGAWPADGYYGEMYSQWSDSYVNNTNSNTVWNHNVPADGKWDQYNFGNEVELMVGRVHLGELPAFPQNEVQLIKNYLNRAHGFKHAQWAPPNTSAVYDNLWFMGNAAPAATGYQAGAALVGHQNLQDIVPGTSNLSSINSNQYLISHRVGNGTQDTYQGSLTFIGIYGVHTIYDLVANANGTVFNMSFGSYFGDWDNHNNYLRALIANGNGLTSVWSGVPNYYFHAMGMGEPVGECIRQTMNNTSNNYTPINGGWQGEGITRMHTGLMGDPTLRMRMTAPPSGLTASAAGSNLIFSWTASPENVQGYYLYRINTQLGTIEKISGLATGTSYTVQNATYNSADRFMVRASTIRATGSGTYEDLSLGAFAYLNGSPVVDCLGVSGGTALPGTSCNDGNANTINDVYLSDCSCSGSLANFDCNGVANGPNVPGTACNDGNASTINDIYQNDCSCSGSPANYDCNGVANGPAIPGSPCNDNDPNTTNDVFDANCNCSGTSNNQINMCFYLGGNGVDPDIEESSNGNIYSNAGSLDLVFDSELPWNWRGNQTIGLHYGAVTIPQGAQITSAYVQFTAKETVNYGPCQLNIAAHASANSDGFSYNLNDLSNRPLTQSSVSWSPAEWQVLDQAGPNQRTPDLSNVLQEIVNNGAWNSGNQLSLIITGTGGRQAYSWNDDASKAAVLCVSYTNNPPLPVDCNGVPGGSAVPGSPCDDGDPNTTNDSYASDCSCAGIPNNSNSITVCANLGSNGDPDVEEANNGNIYTAAGAFDLVFDSEQPWNWRGNQTSGLFFEQINVPQGAVIEDAHIQFTAAGIDNYDPVNISIAAEDNANPAIFGYHVNELSARSLTSASVSWAPPAWNAIDESGLAQRTPDLKSIVQSLVSRTDWQANNNMVFTFSGYGGRQAYSSQQDASKAAKLCITYSSVSAPLDCLGIPGGSAVLDDCGVCNGNNDCLNTIEYFCFILDPSGADDQEESSSGNIYPDAGMLDLVYDSELPWNWRGNQSTGLRYQGVNIPQGAIIEEARIQFTAAGTTNYNPCHLSFTGEASDNSSAFGWSLNNISSRPTVNASIGWDPGNWNTMNEASGSQRSPEIKSVIQAIVDRPGWNAGNALSVIISGYGGRQAYSSEMSPTAAPKLCVTWRVPATQRVQEDSKSEILLYPNPSNGQTYLHYELPESDKQGRLSLYTLEGQLVKRFDLNGSESNFQFSVNEMDAGLYYFVVEQSSHVIGTGKLSVLR